MNRLTITNKNYRPPTKPWDAHLEGFCATCQGYTTNYNSRGECNTCGTTLREAALEQCDGCNRPADYCGCP